MVRLSLRPLSLYGKKVTRSLNASLSDLNQHCSCPPGESCSVEITELPGRRFEVVVTRPRPTIQDHGWTPIASIAGMYRLTFDKRASANKIREAIKNMVGAAIESKRPYREPAAPLPEELNIVLVNSQILRRALRLVVGCRHCSPSADIPFSCILDSVTGSDPSTTTYMLAEGSARCPRCGRNIREDSLVEFDPAPQQTDRD
jgi:hypothetical protein